MKKYISLFLILFVLLTNVITPLAADEINVIVGEYKANVEETVEVPVKISNNTVLLAMLLTLTYDTDRLSLERVDSGDLLEGAVFSETVEDYPYIMIWNSASSVNFTEDGVLVTLTFKVKEDAEEGNAFIELTYEDDNVYDVDLNNVSLNIQNGYVRIEKDVVIDGATIIPTLVPKSTNNTISSGSKSTNSSSKPKATHSPEPQENSLHIISESSTNMPENIDNTITLQIGNTKATVFGKVKQNDVAPIIVNDRTMVPIRFVAENLDAEVEWIEPEKKVLIYHNGSIISLIIDSDVADIDGKKIVLDSPAFIDNDRTYVPIRFIAEGLGATVDWNDQTKEVIITQ